MSIAESAIRSIGTWKRYGQYLRKSPEMTFTWHDPSSNARAWLVINSTRGGAAGGGTRMRAGCDPREVVYLAKAMELKFSISGPPIGGAKSGIDFDPADPRKAEVLERWYKAITPFLRERYGTGGDFGVDEIDDVIPAFAHLGLEHPQQGIVRGHLKADDARFAEIIQRLDDGIAAPAGTMVGFTIADVVTGFGVGQSIEQLYRRRGRDLEGARILLEGFGNVGAACGLYLARVGARIVGISDAHGWLASRDGLRHADMIELIERRSNKLLPADDRRYFPDLKRDAFFRTPADVFVCAAISGSLDENRLSMLQNSGVGVLACGANQPFAESRIGSTAVAQQADRRFEILADIVANCGMARTFSYLMESNAVVAADAILAAVESTITRTVDDVIERAGGARNGLLAATLALALDRVGAD